MTVRHLVKGGRAVVRSKSLSHYGEASPAGISTLHARGVLGILVASAVLALITANGCHIFLATKSQQISLIPSLIYGGVKWLWWGIVAAAMWWIARRIPTFLSFSRSTIALQFGLGAVICIFHLSLLQLTWRAGLHWSAWRMTYPSINYFVLSSFGSDLLIYGFIFGISGFLHAQSQRQVDAILKLGLEKQLSEAQLQTLQAQMEPHFLFNTLNAITSLVAQGRNPEAMQTLAHLNTILRMTLQRRAPEKVRFTEELRVVESYLAIQQVRFADRLQVKIEATPEALQGLVPCFLLQPLVENAVQHGVAQMEAGGIIETSVKRIGDTLWMQVRDNGHGTNGSDKKGHGIGMQNIRDRLTFFYPDAHEFRVVTPQTGGYEVTIQIPYEQAPA
jgi:sensor histidine kinase YesM